MTHWEHLRAKCVYSPAAIVVVNRRVIVVHFPFPPRAMHFIDIIHWQSLSNLNQ